MAMTASQRNDPFARELGADHIANRKALASDDLLKIGPVARVKPPVRVPRDSDVGAVRGKQQNIADVVRQFLLHLPQESIVCAGVCQACRHGAAEAGQQIFEATDVVIDLNRKQPRPIEGALDCLILIVAQLAPQANADGGEEGKYGGNHQPQQARSDCA